MCVFVYVISAFSQCKTESLVATVIITMALKIVIYFFFAVQSLKIGMEINLTLTILWANSADEKFMIFFCFPRKYGDNLHMLSMPIFWKK